MVDCTTEIVRTVQKKSAKGYHSRNTMQTETITKIDCGIGKTSSPKRHAETQEKQAMTTFHLYMVSGTN